jgi:hypothetical protein
MMKIISLPIGNMMMNQLKIKIKALAPCGGLLVPDKVSSCFLLGEGWLLGFDETPHNVSSF